jgi:phosphatidate cytidylyltransferase
MLSGGILIGLIVFALHPWVNFVLAALAGALAMVAVWEYEQLAKAKGGKMRYYALAPLTIAIISSYFISSLWPDLKSPPLFVVILSVCTFFALHFRDKEGAIVDLAVSFFGLFYVAVPIGMMIGILYHPKILDGRYWIAYLLIVTKITDIGAYFAGSLWGKKKLAPHISPGKTVEGAIFGWVCAMAASFAFYSISHFLNSDSFRLSFSTSLWLGAILGVASQFGDLSESLLKRDAGKKDSNQLPGIGGALDMVDSLLFTAPILYMYLL